MSLQNTDYDQEPIEQALRQGEGDAYWSSPWACREVCRKAGCEKSAPQALVTKENLDRYTGDEAKVRKNLMEDAAAK